MKKLLLILFMVTTLLSLPSCKTKKSVIDHKTEETEKVTIQDKSTEEKKVVETETEKKSVAKEETDKSVIEEWMSIESDKIIITDKEGNRTEIINPKINKNKSQKNDNKKSDQSSTDKQKKSESEENKQTDIITDVETEKKSNVKEKHTATNSTAVWLWLGGALAVVATVLFIINKLKII